MKPVLYAFVAACIVWVGVSWFLTKDSRQHFDAVVEFINTSQTSNLVEVELSDYDGSLFGASAQLTLTPTTGLLERFEQQRLVLKRLSGPVFINSEGLQFGVARWQISAIENSHEGVDAPEPTSIVESQPFVNLLIGFSETATLQLDLDGVTTVGSGFKQLNASGNINLESLQHEITVQLKDAYYQDTGFKWHIPEATVVSMNANKADPAQPLDANLTTLTINAPGSDLTVQGELKKIPLNLESHGSIWVNNDTLSSDWAISLVKGHSAEPSSVGILKDSDSLRADVTMQFRELLLEGFTQYLRNQADVFHLLQQVEWAMEEVETPEQQDFLRSLFIDAERIEQSLLDSPLKPLLIKNRSQLAVNAEIRSGDDESSQLSLGGSATGHAGQPELTLKGQVKIVQSALSERWQSVLERWGKRRWFRRYETVYESDLTLRKEQLLLNNFIVSVDRLSAELSQSLTDQ